MLNQVKCKVKEMIIMRTENPGKDLINPQRSKLWPKYLVWSSPGQELGILSSDESSGWRGGREGLGEL